MKKFILLICFVLASIPFLHAQESDSPKTYIIGGSTSFSIKNNHTSGIFPTSFPSNNYKQTSFSFSPYFAKVISKRFTLGVAFEYNFSNFSTDLLNNEDVLYLRESKYNEYGINFFGRLYLNPQNKLQFYLKPNIGFNTESRDTYNDKERISEYNLIRFQLALGLGALYNINHRMNATLSVGGLSYSAGRREKIETKDERNFNSLSFNIHPSSIYWGIEYKF